LEVEFGYNAFVKKTPSGIHDSLIWIHRALSHHSLLIRNLIFLVIGVCEIIVFSNGRTFKGIREYSGEVANQFETVVQCPQCSKAWIARHILDKALWLPDDLEWAPYYVYVLGMPEAGHFYVGMTSDIKTRIDAHWKGRGHEWTKGKGRLKLVEITPCDSERAPILEREKTLEYIECFGSNNVRGSRFGFKKKKKE